MSEVQVLPLPKVYPIWEHPGISKYPETIKVSFSDGKVLTYFLDVKQPSPYLEDAIERMDRLRTMAYEGVIPGQISIDDLLKEEER